MAEKKNPSRRASDSRSGKQQTDASRSVQENKQQQPIRRNDVIRCENCGEDYSITYKRCPFCDERPGRTGVGGRRVSENGARGTVHPVQLIGLIVSMILIIAALFIVIKYVGPLFFGDRSGGSSSSVSTSQSVASSSGSQSGASASQSSGSTSGDVSVNVPDVDVTSLTLNKTDITLMANETFLFEATVSPAEATVVWSSSDESILKIGQDGIATNVNTSGSKAKVTVTATAGEKTAECTVYCNSSGSSTSNPPSGGGTATQQPSGSTTVANKQGVITNAGSGLNIRSGPGSSYDVLASAANGAEVTVLEDAGNGWYKIDYGNGKSGYVSSSYVKLK